MLAWLTTQLRTDPGPQTTSQGLDSGGEMLQCMEERHTAMLEGLKLFSTPTPGAKTSPRIKAEVDAAVTA
jgi:hypothetical protein